MNVKGIIKELKALGNVGIKKVLIKHGAKEPLFGVRIEDLKKIQRRIKIDYQLALDLYDTGISDAMYLAGLTADPTRMTRKDLKRWAEAAHWHMIAGYTVPWVASGSKHGWELALEWIESRKENVAVVGWGTLGSLVSIKEDSELDLAELKRLLKRAQATIHKQPDYVRYVMNGFVIAVGSYVKSLTDLALEVGAKIGPVSVDMGNTACKVPLATEYIEKVRARGAVGKKRKMAGC